MAIREAEEMEPKSIGTRSICKAVNERLSGRVSLKEHYKDDTLTFLCVLHHNKWNTFDL